MMGEDGGTGTLSRVEMERKRAGGGGGELCDV